MKSPLILLYESQFVQICNKLFEIANLEHYHRNNCFLHRAPKDDCSDFEYRCLLIDDTLRGLLNSLFGLNISLSLISQYPSDEYMHQYDYSAKGYALYHYSVICHKLSTIRDLYHKLVNAVCKCQVKPDRHGNISWEELKKNLRLNNKYCDVLKIINNFQVSFGIYIKDRQRSSHDGLVFNNIFSDMDLTEFITALANDNKLSYPDSRFVRGTVDNNVIMEQSKQQFVDLLDNIIQLAYNNASSLFNTLQTILIKDLDKELSANIACWNRINKNSFSHIEDFLFEIINTQIEVYVVEPDIPNLHSTKNDRGVNLLANS